MFDHIIGNTKNKTILENIIKNDKVAHSYIFAGPDGIGKQLFAKEFAKAILCDSESNKPCNTCKSCIEFENFNHPDIKIIDEEDKLIKIDIIKELTKKDVLEKPLNNKKKIYIINNSENLRRDAQNVLLKTLEEPSEYIVIILITSNTNMLLNTIKSRCIKILFNSLTDDEVKKYFDQDISDNIVKYSNGSISKALQIKDKEDIYNEINKKIRSIDRINQLELMKLKSSIFSDEDDTDEILEYINILLLDMSFEKPENTVKYNNCIKIVEETKNRLSKNANYDMTIDNCLLSLWEEING